MKLVEFVPPEPHPLWKLCLQMGITDVIVKVMDHDPEQVIAGLAAAGLRGDHVPEMEGDRLLTADCVPGYFTLGRLFANGYLKALLKGTET